MKHNQRRGFLLIVVIGVLALMLAICVGFLSYTRGEVQSVSNQRDGIDTSDVFHTAADWTIASIAQELMPGGSFDSTKIVAQARSGGNWWYRPYELGMGKLLNDKFKKSSWDFSEWKYIPDYDIPDSTEAQWIYLPADYFPGGGMRGRFMVQVLDMNSCINVNDWNEDCNPSQCQMAHMLMDAYGDRVFESCRAWRDTGNTARYACPIRYQEAWRAASRTERYPDWMYYYWADTVDNVASYNWVTGNSTWFGLFGPGMGALRSNIQSDGMALQASYQAAPAGSDPFSGNLVSYDFKGSANYYPVDPPDGARIWHVTPPFMPQDRNHTWNEDIAGQGYYLSGMTCQSYIDPDTGRSPVNVNTCYNSGEYLPMNMHRTDATYTMEAVFNVESLRRIIKVGNFWTGTMWKNAQTDWSNPDPVRRLTDAEKMKVEQLKTKLAFQYQETLCRYFTASYAHAPLEKTGGSVSRTWQGDIGSPAQHPVYKMFDDVRKYPDYAGPGKDLATYASVYPNALPQPQHACAMYDYSTPRFNTDLKTFRQWVRDDLLRMTQNNTLWTPAAPLPPVAVAGMTVYGPDVTDGTVSFDASDAPQIAPGKLDMRTAAAVYDNIVPGKPTDLNMFNGCQAFKTAKDAYPKGDPIWEMYSMQVGRQEDMDDKYNIDPTWGTYASAYPGGASPTGTNDNNIYGYWTDNAKLGAASYFTGYPGGEVDLKDHTGANMNLCAKGRELCLQCSGAPYGPGPTYDFTGNLPIDPQGPWEDTQTRAAASAQFPPVPSRQLAFGPDSFSTELTTTTTTFMLVINAQLVDAQSVTANPNNPDLQRVMYWGQFGLVVELAPDVLADGDVDARNPDRDYYKRELPKYRKTGQNDLAGGPWTDNACPSLISRNWYGSGAKVSVNPTGVQDWKTDIRGVPPAGTANARGADIVYSPANQTAKRIFLRSIWSLNQGIQQ